MTPSQFRKVKGNPEALRNFIESDVGSDFMRCLISMSPHLQMDKIDLATPEAQNNAFIAAAQQKFHTGVMGEISTMMKPVEKRTPKKPYHKNPQDQEK